MDEPARAAPLRDRHILVTRAREQAGGLLAQLRALGAAPVECPAIAIAPPQDGGPLDAAVARRADYDWIVFTSVNGVAAFVERVRRAGDELSIASGQRIAAIGPATAAALAGAGLPPAFVPTAYVAEALVEQIGPVAGRRILLPRAAIARAVLAEGLRARGALVDEVAAYRIVPAPLPAAATALLRAGAVDAVTFTSSSTVRYLLTALAKAGIDLPGLRARAARPAVVCIGPITARTAQDAGLPVDAVADEYTIAGLLAALLRLSVPPDYAERT